MVLPLSVSYATLGSLNLLARDADDTDWMLEDLTGWGSPAGTIAPIPKPRQAGAWAGLSYTKPRSLVLKGTTVAPTSELASSALDALISAVTLDDTLLTVVESGRARAVTVRRDGEIIPTWNGPRSFTWSFQVVAVDPRKFGTQLTDSTLLPAFSGGLTIPFTIPFTINSTRVSGQVSLNNPGNEVGPVWLRVDGPCVGPVITHVGSGSPTVFSMNISLGTGEFLLIDMEKREVLANGQSSRNTFITSRGWSGFDPGTNTWSFTAASYSPTALLTVSATPAWQ